MTDYMAQASARFFDSQRKKSGNCKEVLSWVEGKYYIPVSSVVDFIETLQEKTKETYYSNAFVPNFANKLFSSDDRAVKKTPILDDLKANPDMKMGIYDFVKLMAVIERQQKAKKVGV